MVLGKIHGPGCLTNLDNRRTSCPTVLAASAGGVVWTFFFSHLSFSTRFYNGKLVIKMMNLSSFSNYVP